MERPKEARFLERAEALDMSVGASPCQGEDGQRLVCYVASGRVEVSSPEPSPCSLTVDCGPGTLVGLVDSCSPGTVPCLEARVVAV